MNASYANANADLCLVTAFRGLARHGHRVRFRTFLRPAQRIYVGVFKITSRYGVHNQIVSKRTASPIVNAYIA